MSQNMFSEIEPTRFLWVSADAAPGGDGSQGSPFRTIQAAIDIAGAGDAVMVRAGEYHEAVSIKHTGGGGRVDAPLWIISADGPQAAHIIAPTTAAAAFTGSGAENVVLSGFHITGGKNGVQFSQNGSDFTDTPKNIVIQGNLIDGAAQDGIKVDHAENVSILDNVVKAQAGEGVDFVAVINSVISHNDVSGAQGSAGIVVKGGSTRVLVDSNWVHDIRADGISVGGWTDGKFFVPGRDTYEASGIEVSHNVVEDVGKRPINVLGAIHSTIHDNFLEAATGYYTVIGISSGNPSAATPMHSSDIVITGNVFSRPAQWVSATAGDNVNISIGGNGMGVWNALDGSHLTAAAHALTAPPLVSAPAYVPDHAAPAPTLFELRQSGAYTHSFVGTRADRDTLVGTAGNDFLDGKNNQDKMTGGAGDDTYVVDVSADKVIEAVGGGVDTVMTAKTGVYNLAANVENLVLNAQFAQYGVGNGLDNIITSNNFGSKLEGGAGNDILVAGRGGLFPGHGGDQLLGGSGSDIFRFEHAPRTGADILDFTLGEDMIDLRGLFQDIGYTGADPVLDHYLALRSDGADGAAIYFDADGAGGRAETLVALVEHVSPLDLTAQVDWFFH